MGKWNKKNSLEAALKCKSPTEISKHFRGAYYFIKENGLERLAYAHMEKEYFWTKEKILKEAKLYPTLNQFKRKSNSAYRAANKLGIFEEATAHMEKKQKWTKSKVKTEAKKYKSKVDFLKDSKGAYNFAYENGTLDEVCAHMTRRIAEAGHWTKKKVVAEARKYKHRRAFKLGCEVAYAKVLRMGWQKEAFSHMERVGNQELRAVYIFEFSDKSVYVGITGNYERRYKQHLGDFPSTHKTVINKINEGFNFQYYEQHKFFSKEDIVREEASWIFWYRKRGWTILNKAKAGGLGGSNIKWTKEKCFEDAKKFKTRTEWQKKGNKSAYNSAHKNNWLDEVCAHMKPTHLTVPRNYWTLKRCEELARSCEDYSDFRLNHKSAYQAVNTNGWNEKIKKIFKR